MKKTLKYFWAWCWYTFHLLDLYIWVKNKFFDKNSVVILLYHRVIPRNKKEKIFSLSGMVVYQDSFEKQMSFLAQHYNIISLNDFFEARAKYVALPNKTVVITFDDGWEDNYLYALPILKKYNLPATIFLTIDFIGSKKFFWQERIIFLTHTLLSSQISINRHCISDDYKALQTLLDSMTKLPLSNESLYKLISDLIKMDEERRESLIESLESCLKKPNLPIKENSLLTWEQVKEMENYRISFHSHGISHKILTELSENDMMEEIWTSKKILEQKLGKAVKYFAYPNGNYNEIIISMLKEAGYDAALTVDHGINTQKTDAYRLKRINIHETRISGPNGNFSKELFSAYLAGLF